MQAVLLDLYVRVINNFSEMLKSPKSGNVQIIFETTKKTVQKFDLWRIFSRLSRENKIFFAFAARKFGIYKYNAYLCSEKVSRERTMYMGCAKSPPA